MATCWLQLLIFHKFDHQTSQHMQNVGKHLDNIRSLFEILTCPSSNSPSSGKHFVDHFTLFLSRAVLTCVNFVDLEKILHNEYSFSKIGFDTFANEPSEVCYKGLTSYTHAPWIPHLQHRFYLFQLFVTMSGILGPKSLQGSLFMNEKMFQNFMLGLN